MDKDLIAPHKEAIFFYKACGAWPGGDPNEIYKAAKEIDPTYEPRLGCSECFHNAVTIIFNSLDPKEYQEYKQRKGL